MMQSLDPYQRPPTSIRDVYKKYQRMKPQHLDEDTDIVHIERDLDLDPEFAHHSTRVQKGRVSVVGEIESNQLTATFRSFAGNYTSDERPISSVRVYEHEHMPGKTLFHVHFAIVVYGHYIPTVPCTSVFFFYPIVTVCIFSDLG
jgi:alkylated DNA repair protein alkB family protein 1